MVNQLLSKLTELDDVEAYLHTFEVVAKREGWYETEWAGIIACLLTGEAQHAYYSLFPSSATEYAALKQEILAWVGLSPVCASQRFFEWTYDPRASVRVQASQLSRLAHLWLITGQSKVLQVAEKVVIDKLLRSLP